MKKLLILLLLAPLFFISCGGDDDDKNEKSPNIEGTWKYTADGVVRTVKFTSNGVMEYSGEDTDGKVKTYKYTLTKYDGYLKIEGFTYIVKAFVRDIKGETVLRTANSNETPPADYPLIYCIYDQYTGADAKLVKEIQFVKIK